MSSNGSTFWSPASRTSASLEVHLLGLVEFDAALALQERMVFDVSGRDDTQGRLLVCEHPPLISIGREGSRAHLRAEPADLRSRQIDVRWLNRGGGCVVHAPGQLAAYPVVPLDRLGLGLAEYRRRLEEGVLDVCRELRIPAERRGEPGVFCRTGQVAQLAVAVKSWVAYQGIFLNVRPDMTLQRLADPPRPDVSPSSLEAQRQRPVSMHAVRESLVRNLASRLEYAEHLLYTGHPLLVRTRKK
ncbi:MAG: hypothetical protein WD066_04400, partial [Planctomycetaceae bacterium]